MTKFLTNIEHSLRIPPVAENTSGVKVLAQCSKFVNSILSFFLFVHFIIFSQGFAFGDVDRWNQIP